VLEFNPSYVQAGVYNVTFVASDGMLADTTVAEITVTEAGNQMPILDPIGSQAVMEGDNLNITITATDPDGTIPTLSAENLPENATFDPATGIFDFTPALSQAGIYSSLFIATDGLLADSETVQIVVNELGNRAPVFADFGEINALEGLELNVHVVATDPDGDNVTLFINTDLESYNFVDSGGGVGSFTFTPDYYHSGVIFVQFIAMDDAVPPMTGIENVPINIIEVNQPPEITPVDSQMVLLGDSLVLRITATDSTDVDGGMLYFSALAKPDNSTFYDSTTNAALFVFKPTMAQIGFHTLSVICYDDEEPPLSDMLDISIEVVESNLPPELDPIEPQMVTEGYTLEFTISATDPEDQPITLTAQDMPENATFVDAGDGTGTLTYNPDFQQSGLVEVKFRASDGLAYDEERVFIQTYDNPQRPELTIPGPQSIVEGEHLEFPVSATDPVLTTPQLFLDNPELNVGFVDNNDGTGLFTFNPVFADYHMFV